MFNWFKTFRAKRREAREIKKRQAEENFKHLREILYDRKVDVDYKPVILTCPQGVVSYIRTERSQTGADLASQLVSWLGEGEDPLSQKIRHILAANPNADLRSFESTLGVKFLSVQLKTDPLPPPQPPPPPHIDV